ncbi:putative Transcriptional regulator LysR family [Verrucomicrobia bacterium]|nr:putative Transcriptional regulator LysR family [Verrucomicrobiota bacterium]
MFGKLFAESGLSLDRLKALLEVGAGGSIVKAADGDPVRQSQYSRQIKELEDFFRIKLIERQGKGTRLTPSGRELARISRFFMLGLSNFQRGCLSEEQRFRIGASATFIRQFLLPVLSPSPKGGPMYATEIVSDEEAERRLHDLTLDFGVVGSAAISRPLQTKVLGRWKLELWAPKALSFTETSASKAFKEKRLPLVLARKELERLGVLSPKDYEVHLVCDNFLQARAALEGQAAGAFLPSFLAPGKIAKSFVRVRLPKVDSRTLHFYLAWNPRLLRLNPHATRRRDWLAESLSERMAGCTVG